MRTLADRLHEKAKADADDRELESRSDRRRQQDARETSLKALATRLVSARATALGRLGLDEELLAAIATAQAIRSAPARNRQINVVRQHLRALGPAADALARRLDAPRSYPESSPERAVASAPPPVQASADVDLWLERLAGGGDEALEALLAERENADRQLLRQRTRELARARASSHALSIARAEARLRDVLGALLGS